MNDSLTIGEAVPLGTVHLQRLLGGAGVRSLVIKGPAFSELGVRAERQSSDIDLLIHPDDRAGATATLVRAGWSIISYWFPPALDDVIYSTTFRHQRFPTPLDLHHCFSGLLQDAGTTFEALWQQRTTVQVAHQGVVTVGRDHALVLEALNAMKLLPAERRMGAVERVVDTAGGGDPADVAAAAESVGARHTADPLITALGGPAPSSPPPPGLEQWLRRGARNSGRRLIVDLLVRAPWQIPRVVWGQLTIDPDTARFWAEAHRVPYRNRWQVLGLRVRRLFRRYAPSGRSS